MRSCRETTGAKNLVRVCLPFRECREEVLPDFDLAKFSGACWGHQSRSSINHDIVVVQVPAFAKRDTLCITHYSVLGPVFEKLRAHSKLELKTGGAT